MFQALQPLVAERAVHLLISSSKDGRLSVYVEPSKIKDDEDAAFVTPFRAQATAAELDEQFAAILSQWITSRQASNKTLAQLLADAEAASKAAADEAKKKAAEKYKKPTVTTTPTKAVAKVEAKPVAPSLLDALDTPPKPVEVAPAAASVAAATVASATTAVVEESAEVEPETASPEAEQPVVQPTAPVETVQAAPASVVAEVAKTEPAAPAAPATIAPTVSTEPSTLELW